MDRTTAVGLAAGLLALIGGFLLEGGHLEGLVEYTALLIVFGGTFAAVTVSFPWTKLRGIPDALRFAFRLETRHPAELVDQLVEMATVARREGVLALERQALDHPDPFLRSGLLMVVDGTDPELTRQIMELEMDAAEQHRQQQAAIFEAAGGYAPTMGIIGTVMGLIHVLGNLEDPGALGPSIAVAFTATLYGVASANILYLPLAMKIKSRQEEQALVLEMLVEGVLAVQAGHNPQLIRKKLSSYLPFQPESPRSRGEREDADAAQA
ncbi:flagellar motor protein [Paenibacillus sp. IB182496]|uniref:Flagellar motor protein n=1 Tax=Paenibacillus sabuli TaxID=2772509 RepID=A0A927BY32_9BACL|nr:flagellar motor protein [Paenibacillus sabuli]MBD2848482.1 flagellar motor protein [Paenibacillus sabuli]